MRALIVDKSRLFQQLLSALFNPLGIEVFQAENLETARSLIAKESFEIITCGHYFDDGDGIDFITRCRKDVRHAKSLILFLLSTESEIPEAARDIADEVLFKTSPEQMSRQINQLVNRFLDSEFSAGKVLLVEDDDALAMLFKSELELSGYEIVCFPTAEEAWEAFNQQKSYGSNADAYDLVMTDINLPGRMNGKQLIQKIRLMDDARGVVPIIAITADNSDKLRVELFRLGVNDYLAKPILIQELIIRASNLVRSKRLLDQVHDTRRQLYLMATTDKLTGCHNRHSLTEFSEKFIAEAARHGYPVSLLVIDLDHFKSINDTHGHAIGDNVLAETGKMLREAHRDGDLVARFGGEEFVLLLNHCDQDNARKHAEKIRLQLEQLKPSGLTVTASIGVTTMDQKDPKNFESLFNAADKGVYQAKENGRNQVVFEDLY